MKFELFFKDLAKYCKNLMEKAELGPEQGLEIVAIYYSLNKIEMRGTKKSVR